MKVWCKCNKCGAPIISHFGGCRFCGNHFLLLAKRYAYPEYYLVVADEELL